MKFQQKSNLSQAKGNILIPRRVVTKRYGVVKLYEETERKSSRLRRGRV